MTHLIRGSIACWDCKHFVESEDAEDLQCLKGYEVCEGRECLEFEESQGD